MYSIVHDFPPFYSIPLIVFFIYFSIDASNNDGRMGRLINHSMHPNIKPNVIEGVVPRNGGRPRPYVYFTAITDIAKGEELLFNYGDNRREIHAVHTWFKK